MEIKVGRYILNSDSRNYWIDEEFEISRGKHKGEIGVRHLTGYCWTLEKCLQSFRERSIGGTDATTLSELLEALKEVYENMDALNRAAFEQGLKKLEDCGKAE